MNENEYERPRTEERIRSRLDRWVTLACIAIGAALWFDRAPAHPGDPGASPGVLAPRHGAFVAAPAPGRRAAGGGPLGDGLGRADVRDPRPVDLLADRP